MLLYFCCEGLSYLSYRKGCSLWQIQPVWKKAVNKIKIRLWRSEYIFIFMDHREFSWRRNIFGISNIQFTLTLTLSSVAQSFLTLCRPMDCSPPGSSVHGVSQQECWSGCHCLLQGIFLTQGFNLSLWCLLHWQAGVLPLIPPEKSWH